MFSFYTFYVYSNELIGIIKTSSGNTLMIQHEVNLSFQGQRTENCKRKQLFHFYSAEPKESHWQVQKYFSKFIMNTISTMTFTKWLTQPEQFHSVCMRKVLFLFMCCSSRLFIFYVLTVCCLCLITFFWRAKDKFPIRLGW